MEGVTAPSSQVYKVGGEVQRDVDSVSVNNHANEFYFFSKNVFFRSVLEGKQALNYIFLMIILRHTGKAQLGSVLI